MPEATVAAPASEWTMVDGILVEPRLWVQGIRHGMTLSGHGDMGDPTRRAPFGAPLTLKQVHGAAVLEASRAQNGAAGDGLVSRRGGPAVAVFSADCLPVLLWSEDGSVVAAVHAGWRGLAAGVLEAAVAATGAAPGLLSAAVAPHIGPCCYEVGPELEDRFAPDSFSRASGRLTLDLGAEALRRLAAAGVPPALSSSSARCTSCTPGLFSWRRDGVRRSMMAFIAPL